MANEYQTPPVSVQPVSGVALHSPRDRSEVDPDVKDRDKSVAKATDVPSSPTVRSGNDIEGTAGREPSGDAKSEFGPQTDPANLVQAQESAGQAEAKASAEEKRRATVATASEMVGAPEDLARLDQNRDGRIDQLELQHAFRADGEDTTYAALSNYQKTLGFSDVAGTQVQGTDKPEKLFADEIAAADKAKLLETGAQSDQAKGGDTPSGDGPADSVAGVPKGDPQVKIVV